MFTQLKNLIDESAEKEANAIGRFMKNYYPKVIKKRHVGGCRTYQSDLIAKFGRLSYLNGVKLAEEKEYA